MTESSQNITHMAEISVHILTSEVMRRTVLPPETRPVSLLAVVAGSDYSSSLKSDSYSSHGGWSPQSHNSLVVSAVDPHPNSFLRRNNSNSTDNKYMVLPPIPHMTKFENESPVSIEKKTPIENLHILRKEMRIENSTRSTTFYFMISPFKN